MTKPSSSGRKNKPVTISISPTSLAPATQGTTYSQTITVSGGVFPYNFSVIGTLPTGLALSFTGILSGTPTASGGFSFTIQAADSMGHSGSKSYNLNITPVTIAITPISLTSGMAGVAYSQTFTASGGVAPYAFTATTALPTGLAINSNGVLFGTPTIAGGATFTIQATDSRGYSGTASCSLTITVPAPPPPPPAPPPPTGAGIHTGSSSPDLTGYTIKSLKADYGGHGNGTDDDTVAINNAFAALAPGIALHIPVGVYKTTSHINNPINKNGFIIYGDGPDLSIIQPTVQADIALQPSGCYNFKMYDFAQRCLNQTSRQTNANYMYGIIFTACHDGLVHNVRHVGGAGAGMLMTKCYNMTAEYCEVNDNWADGFHITGPGSSNNIVQYSKYTNNPISIGDDAFASIGIANATGGSYQIDGTKFLYNQAYDGAWAGGVGIEGSTNFTVIGNQIYRSGIAGIRIDSQSSFSTSACNIGTVDNNILQGCVTRTNTGHGSIFLLCNWSGGATGVTPYVRGVTADNNQIIYPASGAGVRAMGFSTSNNVQASFTNTAMTGVATPWLIQPYATINPQN